MAVERGSDKHGRLLDEELKHEVEGIVRSGRSTHAEEWADPEPAAEGDPDVDRVPHGSLTGGVPPGIDAEDVAGRSELAQHLPPSAFPATAQALRAYAEENHAPAGVLAVARAGSGRPGVPHGGGTVGRAGRRSRGTPLTSRQIGFDLHETSSGKA